MANAEEMAIAALNQFVAVLVVWFVWEKITLIQHVFIIIIIIIKVDLIWKEIKFQFKKKGLNTCPAGWDCNNSSLLPIYSQCGGNYFCCCCCWCLDDFQTKNINIWIT